ncbi:hypothetical protein ACIRST_41305 [Kitasatospora sp. NPDC101447]|uniref:hypothetical protein n=1 Tax=Kitasatospora sp. NPDC101447 TaxID=3364102 RepID=UPI00382B1DC9
MAGEHHLLHTAGGEDPIWRLWSQLPEPWRGPVIGDGIDDWEKITENGDARINLRGLPAPIPAELAWMSYWQALDGTRSSVLGTNQLANILRRAIRENYPFPPSIRAMDWETAAGLQRWFYATRWGRLAPREAAARLRVIFRFSRLALLARCSDGSWWTLDEWHPRCDPRIPLTEHEPQAHYGCSPSKISHPWLREAANWWLGTQLEAGVLRWSTVGEKMRSLVRFDRWLSTFAEPTDVLGDPAHAIQLAAAFRRWSADPANRLLRRSEQRFTHKPVHPRQVNDDLRAVAELFAFVAANPNETRQVLGPHPWSRVTDTHAAGWLRQLSRVPRQRDLNDEHYVDDHALAQIPAALPLLGLPRSEHMAVTRGDGQQVTARGFDDPQAMRMILLQILTGRRASEIRTCRLDCLSPVPDRAVDAAEGEQIARFHYAQSKIDIAPDNILVDREVVAVIEEQRQWIRDRFPGITPRHLFLQRTGNPPGRQALPLGHLQLDAPRVQQDREDHRQQGPARRPE